MEKDPTDTMAFIAFNRQRRVVSNLLDYVEHKYYQDRFHEHKKDYKRIFKLWNGLLGCNKDLPLPQANSEHELADWFNKFFTNKMESIRTKLCDINKTTLTSVQTPPTEKPNINLDCSLEEFSPLTEKDVIRFVFRSPSKPCEVDSVLTERHKDIMESIAP